MWGDNGIGVKGGMEGGLRLKKGYIHDHLLSAKKRVADELAGAQRDWLLACHNCGTCRRVNKGVPRTQRYGYLVVAVNCDADMVEQ